MGFVFGWVQRVSLCVFVINWKAESAVYVIRRAAQGVVSALNLFTNDGATGHTAWAPVLLGCPCWNWSGLLIAAIDQL